jgi:hypothetical protein
MNSLVRVGFVATVIAATGWGGQAPVEGMASLLRPGMQLVYASGGVESPPWTVDSITRSLMLEGHTGCVRIFLRTTPTQPTAEARTYCTRETTLLSWDVRAAALRPARPLGLGTMMENRQANGGLVRFETLEPTVENIPLESGSSGASAVPTPIDVIPTTVTTFDSTGQIVRRLRERFSVALATATGGVFEVPDTTQSSGWRTIQRFELVAIRVP